MAVTVKLRTIAVQRVPAKGQRIVKVGRVVLKTSEAFGTRANWYKGLDFADRDAALAYAKKAGLKVIGTSDSFGAPAPKPAAKAKVAKPKAPVAQPVAA
ncbi:MAG: hypothetical protein ACREQ5_18415 [Candidatus Dormibacteria bacterium]